MTMTSRGRAARVWAGVHFRLSDEAGATLGRRVGDDALRLLERR
jgi:hypothetical protein